MPVRLIFVISPRTHLLDLAGPDMPEDFNTLQRVQTRITQWQETGRVAGIANAIDLLKCARDLVIHDVGTFNAGKQAGFPVHLAIADLKAWTQGRRDHAYILLDLVLDLVGVEGAPVPPKLALLKQLAWSLRIDERDAQAGLSQRDAALAQAEAAMSRADSQLANLRQGKRPEEIRVIEASLASARAQGAGDDSPVAVFAALREWKNRF